MKSRTSGVALSAFSAEAASLILLSSTLIAKTVPGTLSVVPTPTNDVDAIPIACVLAAPA